ncbi:uncharacterized protein [Nicotiana tomentosiformis]|uniref:uncharacterized protein n=1 Tax=Nicotiana tomentosiformis TaxID=4098 RepID=UPI00388CE1D4
MEGKKVLLRVSPIKGVMRFGKKGKLSPQYIVPFEVLERVGEVAYKLSLPPTLSGVHLVFHVFMLQKCYEDPSHVLDFRSTHLDKDLTYDDEPVAILDRQVRKLRSKNIAFVKVQWRGQQDTGSVTEFESQHVTFLEDEFPKKGEDEMIMDIVPNGSRMNVLDPSMSNIDPNGNNDE